MIETIQDIKKHLDVFKKKFQNFRSRSPIYFNYLITPMSISIYSDSELDEKNLIKEFNINYNIPIEDFIYEIREYLRDNVYPKIIKTEIIRIDPPTKLIHSFMKEQNIPFDEAFNKLSTKVIKKELIVDKIDLAKNRIVLYNKKIRETKLYQVNMPVLVFVRKLKELEESERSIYFQDYCKEVTKR